MEDKKENYTLFGHNDQLPETYAAGLFYQSIPGKITRVEMKSLDAQLIGNTPQIERDVLEITVSLQWGSGERIIGGGTRDFRFLEPRNQAGLMRELGAEFYERLLSLPVLTHYDASQTPPLIALSHADALVPKQQPY